MVLYVIWRFHTAAVSSWEKVAHSPLVAAACTCEVCVDLCAVNEDEHNRHHPICFKSLLHGLPGRRLPGSRWHLSKGLKRSHFPNKLVHLFAPWAAVSNIVFFNCVSEITLTTYPRDFTLCGIVSLVHDCSWWASGPWPSGRVCSSASFCIHCSDWTGRAWFGILKLVWSKSWCKEQCDVSTEMARKIYWNSQDGASVPILTSLSQSSVVVRWTCSKTRVPTLFLVSLAKDLPAGAKSSRPPWERDQSRATRCDPSLTSNNPPPSLILSFTSLLTLDRTLNFGSLFGFQMGCSGELGDRLWLHCVQYWGEHIFITVIVLWIILSN